MRRLEAPFASLLAAAALVACGDDSETESMTGITTASSTSASTTETTAGPDPSTTDSGSTDMSGTMGMTDNTMGMTMTMGDGSCTPGETRACYGGPDGTEGVGICVGGIETCLADGQTWSFCEDDVLPQPESCFTPEDDDCDGSDICPGSEFHEWSDLYLATDYSSGDALTVDINDRVVIGGQYGGTFFPGTETHSAPSGEENRKIYIVTYLSDGTPEWSVSLGGDGAQSADAVATDDAGNIFATGYFQTQIEFGPDTLVGQHAGVPGEGNLYIGKLDPNGGGVWGRAFPAPSSQRGLALATDSAGAVFVLGRNDGAIDLGGGPLTAGAFVGKLDSAGAHLWSFDFDATPVDIASDPDGNLIVAGLFSGSLDLGGGAMVANGPLAIFLAKFDPDGGFLWSQSYDNGESFPRVSDIDTGDDGKIFATGFFRDTLSFGGPPVDNNTQIEHVFLAVLNPDASHVWSHSVGTFSFQDGPEPQRAHITADSSGNAYITVDFRGEVDLGGGPLVSFDDSRDIYLARYDTAGAHLWSARYGGPLFQQAHAVDADADGHVVITGHSEGELSFGGEPLLNEGPPDMFVAEFSP